MHISDVRVDQYCCHGERQSDDDISDRLCMLGSCTYYRQPNQISGRHSNLQTGQRGRVSLMICGPELAVVASPSQDDSLLAVS